MNNLEEFKEQIKNEFNEYVDNSIEMLDKILNIINKHEISSEFDFSKHYSFDSMNGERYRKFPDIFICSCYYPEELLFTIRLSESHIQFNISGDDLFDQDNKFFKKHGRKINRIKYFKYENDNQLEEHIKKVLDIISLYEPNKY